MVSSARTDEVLKVIVANPAMIKAYKAGVPGNGQTFPEGSMIVKLQWKPKKSTEAPFAVDVPDVFTPGFRHGKGQQEISENRRLGIRGLQLRSRLRQVHRRCQKPRRLRTDLPRKSEGEGLHLPPVSEALKRCAPSTSRTLLDWRVRGAICLLACCDIMLGHPERSRFSGVAKDLSLYRLHA